MKSCCFCRNFLLLVAVFFAVASSTVQSQAPAARLRGGIREGTRAVLPGSMSPRVLRAKDLGPVRADQPVHGVTLVFRRSEAQEAELQQLLKAQQDPTSSSFHRWLTPESFGQRFGMAEQDLRAAEQWLSGQGFAVSGVSRARDRITFSGTAAQVAAAFSAPVHRYLVDGEEHVAPSADLSLPADLAAVTTAVLHLSDFRPQPMSRIALQPAYSTAGTQTHYLAPRDLAVMYDLPVPSNTSYPGIGQTVAIVGQSYVDVSLNSVIREFVGGSTTLNLQTVLVPGTGVEAVSPIDAVESEIDLEYAAGLLDQAQILLVHVGSDPHFNVFDALGFAIDQNLAPVVSISYGQCETLLSQAELEQATAIFQQAASQGQTLIAASGDLGSTACVSYPLSGTLTAAQQQALAVDFPADSPLVTAVGGTQMGAGTFDAGSSAYWRAAVPPYDTALSLLSYVPEVAWNEGSSTEGVLAGGGGASAFVPRPTWQSGLLGLPAGSTRLLPDLALQASVESPGFLFCTDAPGYSTDTGDTPACGSIPSNVSTYPHTGGTSFAAPTFAAMVALLNQSTQSLGQGNLNPILYQLARDPSLATTVFHDITAGTIACAPGVPRCSAAGQSGFAAGAGYDEATGLGSVDFLHLAAAWPGSSPTRQATTTSISAFYNSIDPGGSDVLTLQVGSVYGPQPTTPVSGGVTVSVDGVVVEQNLPFATINAYSGSATYTFQAPQATGTHVVTVTYLGDGTHGPSQATTAIPVGLLTATGALSLVVTDATVPKNGSAVSTVTVTPMGGYSGRLMWSLSLEGGDGSPLTACYSIPDLLVQGVSTTTLSLGSGTACSTALPRARQGLRGLAVTRGKRTASGTGWAPMAAAGLLVCCLLPVIRTRGPLTLVCVLLAGASGGMMGCGGGSPAGGTSAQATGVTSGSAPVPGGAGTTTYTATLTGRDSVNTAVSAYTTFQVTF